MNIKKYLKMVCLLGLLTTACQKPVFLLNGNTYRLIQKEGASAEIFLSFDEQGKHFFGKVLNRYFGPYTIKAPDIIEFGSIGTTVMAGPQEVMRSEQEYLQFLNHVKKYKVTETTLELTSSKGETKTFEKIISEQQNDKAIK
jgi:heat shock protein HslJ